MASSAPLRPGIHEAVNSAIDTSATDLDPSLVSKITEHVVSALKKEMLTSSATQPAPQSSRSGRTRASSSAAHQTTQYHSYPNHDNNAPLYQPTPVHAREAIPSPPTSPASSHLPARYTPPSPGRYGASSHGSTSPEPLYSDAGSGSRRGSRSSTSGQEEKRSRSRMRPTTIPLAVEETSLEKAWKPLFDHGKPTQRLGQFLRGLAMHLIIDCQPTNSIVVTPGKLANFFRTTELPSEMYPWMSIFGGKLTNQAISKLFISLRCQHHLVQFGDQETPTIPGLTPSGFESFMTVLIQAYPDQEFRRINKAVKDMPISNADEPSERFPKELTRRLFPATSDTMQCQRLAAAVSLDPSIQLNHSSNLPPPPPTQPPSSATNPSFADRGRAAYCNQSSSAAYDDDDLRATSMPIERERKPYSAKEGGGKVYEGRRAPSNGRKSERSQTRTSRSGTGSSTSTLPSQHPATRPIDVNAAPRSHRMSMGGPPPSARYMNSPGIPPASNPYTRSEGTNIADIPPAYYLSNMNPDHDEPPRRSFRRQNTDEEIARGFGVRGSYDGGYDHPHPHSFSGPQQQIPSRPRH